MNFARCEGVRCPRFSANSTNVLLRSRNARCVHLLALHVLVAMSTIGAPARADPEVVRTLSLGHPRRPRKVTVTASGQETLLRSGTVTHRLSMARPREITLEEVVLATDAAIAVVRAQSEEGAFIGLLGGVSGSDLLLFERTDPHGDPGEQHARVVDVARAPVGIRTGVKFTRLSLCGAHAFLFDEQRVDARSLRLVAARTAPTAGDPSPMPVQQEPLPAPRLNPWVPVASSERDPATGLPRAPRALVAPAPDPGFAITPSAAAQLRFEGAPLAIERLGLEVVTAQPQTISLWWLGDQHATWRATVPVPAGGGHFLLTPPQPAEGPCVGLYMEAPLAPVTVRGLRAYTALDRPDGIARVVGWLVQDGKEAGEASDLLARLGAPGAAEVARRWDALSATGKRRALKVLAGHLDDASVRDRVRAAATSDDPALRAAAMDVLGRSTPGRDVLRTLVPATTPMGDEAAEVLARRDDAGPALLDALTRADGDARPRLRMAIAAWIRRYPSQFEAASRSFLARAPPPALGSLALAAARAGKSEVVAAICARADEATRFEDRYRFALALRGAVPREGNVAWLSHEARDASEWMQRRAAFEALARLAPTQAAQVAEALVADPMPRVRASVLPSLIRAGRAERVAAIGAQDGWPLVRSAAITALAEVPDAGPKLARALADPAPSVRRAAIGALARRRAVDAWPQVAERLAARDETHEVRLSAIVFAQHLCVTEATPALRTIAEAVAAREVDDVQKVRAVEALRALHALGGPALEAGAEIVRTANEPRLTALWSGLPAPSCESHDK